MPTKRERATHETREPLTPVPEGTRTRIRSNCAPLAQVLVCVMAAALFAAVMFDVLNADGYLAEWYSAVTGEKWAWGGQMHNPALLPQVSRLTMCALVAISEIEMSIRREK